MKTSHSQSIERAREASLKLLEYCRSNEWAGYDPYDALNSPLFSAFPILDSKIPRLVLTQALKRSPVDTRRWLQVPRTQNPKGLALFLSALLKFSSAGLHQDEETISWMIGRLQESRSPGSAYACWGYSFPWQTRTILVPAGAPNLVCTSFVAEALLDAYEQCGDGTCLEMAVSAAEYILNELYWSDGSVGRLRLPASEPSGAGTQCELPGCSPTVSGFQIHRRRPVPSGRPSRRAPFSWKTECRRLLVLRGRDQVGLD